MGQEGECFRQLLKLESSYAITKKKFGLLRGEEHKFHVRLASDLPIISKPIRYNPPARQWIQDYIKLLIETDLVEEAETEFQAPVVLVPGQ